MTNHRQIALILLSASFLQGCPIDSGEPGAAADPAAVADSILADAALREALVAALKEDPTLKGEQGEDCQATSAEDGVNVTCGDDAPVLIQNGSDGMDGAPGRDGGDAFVLNSNNAVFDSGFVGIGTDQPAAQLHVEGEALFDGAQLLTAKPVDSNSAITVNFVGDEDNNLAFASLKLIGTNGGGGSNHFYAMDIELFRNARSGDTGNWRLVSDVKINSSNTDDPWTVTLDQASSTSCQIIISENHENESHRDQVILTGQTSNLQIALQD